MMTARNSGDGHQDPGHRVVIAAFRLAGQAAGHGRAECRPIHLLQALAGSGGGIGDALQAIRPVPTERTGPSAGVGSTFVLGQTQGAAALFARSRDEPMDTAHLLVALLDQRDPEVVQQFAAARLDPQALRRIALQILGAPLDLAPIRMPLFTPAGTLDRPALEIESLDARAWRVLSWRQDHLPLDRVSGAPAAAALVATEQRAAWRIADQAGVDDDRRYSLLARHRLEVQHRLGAVHPELVDSRGNMRISGGIFDRRFRRRSRLPNFMVGWPTWFENRRTGLRDRWFERTTRSAFRGQPRLDG